MSNLLNLQQWLEEQSIEVAFIHSTENVFYLTNFYNDPHERLMGLFVFRNAEPMMVVPSMEQSQVLDTGWNHEIIGYKDHENPWDSIRASLEQRELPKVDVVALEGDALSFNRTMSLLDLFEGAGAVPVEDQLNEMRVVKSEQEIAIMRRAAEMADYGVEVGVAALKEGVTEMEVLATIEYELKKKGIREMSFSTMVLFGEKSGQPHGNPGERALKHGDFVLFDLGVVLDGYTSDITRTVVYGEVSHEQRRLYQTVLEAQEASLRISQEGTRVGDLDQTARDIIDKAGYGELFPHRIGHGLGINVHEYPSMAHTNNARLKAGMTYTIEPGIYDERIGGVRIEDDVLVTKDGHETLTKYPKNLQVVE
ncbi:dipeptidase [Pontibacillus halophilus JSM 076056 = DSM 19796]|uniref:Dipeptidase n=1 Tax=Pontibacillus halophilus JSM 076056 = DSM 19796 TaxID=1385510 RepID=A0A0A5GI32_9BACI|nr:Xaa-Pro peptidase family protein [Pontibacillus halophilus]KGX91664.1 dipeptidase [Pontibacillus halophilus JSM 076056 = DSM 19796]